MTLALTHVFVPSNVSHKYVCKSYVHAHRYRFRLVLEMTAPDRMQHDLTDYDNSNEYLNTPIATSDDNDQNTFFFCSYVFGPKHVC